MHYPFEVGPIRPVDEADSLLIRTTRNCPWNRCGFCVNYKGQRFSMRSVQDIKQDIEAAAEYFNGVSFASCFLQDGDSLIMKTSDLLEILKHLKDHFPSLETVSSYGRAWSMIRKSPSELKEICSAGLNLLYCGMESGDDKVLELINKGVTSKEIVTAGLRAKESGMRLSEFIILGLGGTEYWRDHATSTAAALNTINPSKIRVLTLGIKEGADLEQKLADGSFSLQTEKNIIEEQKLLLENLEGITSHYANHHGVDLLLEARGQLPEDKEFLLAIMDRFLLLSEQKQRNFILGRRMGVYSRLDDQQDRRRYEQIEEQIVRLNNPDQDEMENIYHSLRARVV